MNIDASNGEARDDKDAKQGSSLLARIEPLEEESMVSEASSPRVTENGQQMP